MSVNWSRAEEAEFASMKERLDVHATLTLRRPHEVYLSRAVGQQGAELRLAGGFAKSFRTF